ncbi:hypothetical protein DFJ73DRAFT_778196 [Zopfochytrium polystomum]|nr:hypothetical protein DFJ73DRAFT_778196 [Zopfochytrium polystomum]
MPSTTSTTTIIDFDGEATASKKTTTITPTSNKPPGEWPWPRRQSITLAPSPHVLHRRLRRSHRCCCFCCCGWWGRWWWWCSSYLPRALLAFLFCGRVATGKGKRAALLLAPTAFTPTATRRAHAAARAVPLLALTFLVLHAVAHPSWPAWRWFLRAQPPPPSSDADGSHATVKDAADAAAAAAAPAAAAAVDAPAVVGREWTLVGTPMRRPPQNRRRTRGLPAPWWASSVNCSAVPSPAQPRREPSKRTTSTTTTAAKRTTVATRCDLRNVYYDPRADAQSPPGALLVLHAFVIDADDDGDGLPVTRRVAVATTAGDADGDVEDGESSSTAAAAEWRDDVVVLVHYNVVPRLGWLDGTLSAAAAAAAGARAKMSGDSGAGAVRFGGTVSLHGGPRGLDAGAAGPSTFLSWTVAAMARIAEAEAYGGGGGGAGAAAPVPVLVPRQRVDNDDDDVAGAASAAAELKFAEEVLGRAALGTGPEPAGSPLRVLDADAPAVFERVVVGTRGLDGAGNDAEVWRLATRLRAAATVGGGGGGGGGGDGLAAAAPPTLHRFSREDDDGDDDPSVPRSVCFVRPDAAAAAATALPRNLDAVAAALHRAGLPTTTVDGVDYDYGSATAGGGGGQTCDVPVCFDPSCADRLGAAWAAHPRGVGAPLVEVVLAPAAARGGGDGGSGVGVALRRRLLRAAGVRYVVWDAGDGRDSGGDGGDVNVRALASLVLQLAHRRPVPPPPPPRLPSLLNDALDGYDDDDGAAAPATRAPPRFLLFMPWEQLNNQLIALRACCAAARLLGRTLVLPKIGFRRDGDGSEGSTVAADWDFSFDVDAFGWADFERYFDVDRAVARLPCAAVTFDAFVGMTLLGRVPMVVAEDGDGGGDGDDDKAFEAASLLPLRVPRWWPARLDAPVFNPVARATSRAQLAAYYGGVLGLPVARRRDGSGGAGKVAEEQQQPQRLAQLTDAAVRGLWGGENDGGGGGEAERRQQQQRAGGARPTLALGAAFWLYGFGRTQPYPLTEYVDYMAHPVYRASVDAVRPRARVQRAAAAVAAAVRRRAGEETEAEGGGAEDEDDGAAERGMRRRRRRRRQSARFVAAHVRRGDYWNKCRRIGDARLRRMCYPSDADVAAAVARMALAAPAGVANEEGEDGDGDEGGDEDDGIAAGTATAVYVATNDERGVRATLDAAMATVATGVGQLRVVYASDVMAEAAAYFPLDAVEAGLVDAEVCVLADSGFVGSAYSSYARTIFERRALEGRRFDTY